MNNFTPARQRTSKMIGMTSRLAKPGKDTLFFLQLFARMYEPKAMMGVA
ncbi:MAG: hypothetical protein IJR02_06750 [Bacteroidaceae bacterium]|jgi:hypothetical protein|nr:hypothetical protein [Bacteroidaceae bacterium]